MILRNHGLLTCADLIADAFNYMYGLQRAREIKSLAQFGGADLVEAPPKIVDGMKAAVALVTKSAGGMIAWAGILRKLDRLGSSNKR